MATNKNAEVSEELNTKDINLKPEPSTVSPFFDDDDVTGKVLNARQNADLDPAQIARLQFAAEKVAAEEVVKEQPISRLVVPKSISDFESGLSEFKDTSVSVLKDVGGGIIESTTQALAGALDAVSEIVDLAAIDPMVAGAFTMALGGGASSAGNVAKAAQYVSDVETPTIEADPRTVTGSLVRGVSQFLTGFGPALKVVKFTGKAAPYIAGAIADATVFDPMEARLSDLIENEFPGSNPITEYLASSPDDTEAEGRFKNALEGLALGGLTDVFMSAVKFIKHGKKIREISEETGIPVEEIIDKTNNIKSEASTRPEGRPDPNALEGQPDSKVPAGREADQVSEDEFIPFEKAAEEASVTIEVPEFKTGSKKATPERAQNINLAKLNTSEDVQNLLDRVAKADSKGINKARREVITNKELPKLANDLGMTVDDLMNRRQGESFNAEQILAARKILVASGENLIDLSKKAANGGDIELALFRNAMSQHRGIQLQVSGMTAEAGRALQSFNVIAESSRAQQRAIKEALDALGGKDLNQAMAREFSEIDITKLGDLVRTRNKVKNIDMFYEVWINGLLSSPATHVVNIVSNTMVAGLAVGERLMARAIGGNIPPGETTAMLKGMVDGARDGFRLGWKALKTGEPADVLEKVEVDARRAISGENLNLSGLGGRFADYIGEVVRVPGRLLTAEDAFFKSVGYRMELNAQAYRQAFNEGLEGEALAQRVLYIVNHPPENIKLAAIDASRYQTFTNSLDDTRIKFIGGIGKIGEKARKSELVGDSAAPVMRVLLPFVRTPTNIASYTLERTPLAFISSTVRSEIKAGGARRDLALAKIATGSMMMAVSADLAIGGTITGAGPVNRDMKNILRETGWQPYSILIDDTYYAYNRLDPIGGLLGMSADMTEILGQTTEADAMELGAAAVLSISQNMASKVYLSQFMGTMDAIFSASTDPMASKGRLKYLAGRMAGSLVPSGVAAIERTLSPGLSATYGFIDKIKSRLPGFSDDLPPRRNIFGEPVVLGGGYGPDIMSPIYTSVVRDNPVADELVAQQVSISMPKQVIDGVELDAQQYDKYILLYSGKDNKFVKNVPLKSALKKAFAQPGYKRATDGPEGGKARVISAIFQAYQSAAKQQLAIEYPKIASDITALKTEELRKLTGR